MSLFDALISMYYMTGMGTAATIQAIIDSAGVKFFVRAYYDKAPIAQAEFIASRIIQKSQELKQKSHVKKRCYTGDRSWKKRLLEAQNHRCGYCGCRMTTTNPYAIDYATFEHYINLRDGGSDGIHNYAMACAFCNQLRDRLNLSAENFCLWIKENPKDFGGQRKTAEYNFRNKKVQPSIPEGYLPLYESE